MFIPLRGLGSLGVIHDSQSQALPIGAWKDARNMRFSGLSMEKMLEPTLEAAFSNTEVPPDPTDVYSCDSYANYIGSSVGGGLHFPYTQGGSAPQVGDTIQGNNATLEVTGIDGAEDPEFPVAFDHCAGSYMYHIGVDTRHGKPAPDSTTYPIGTHAAGFTTSVLCAPGSEFSVPIDVPLDMPGITGRSKSCGMLSENGSLQFDGSNYSLANFYSYLTEPVNLVQVVYERDTSILVWDGANKTSDTKVYINGNLVWAALVDGPYGTNSEILGSVGRWVEIKVSGNGGDGEIAHISYENRARTAGDIAAQWQAVERNQLIYQPDTPPIIPLGEPKWMQGWSDGLSSYVAMAATGEGGDYLWFLRKGSDDDGVWEQAGGPYDSAGQWQSFAWGDTCIFNNGLNPPQIYNPNRARFEDLPNWGLISTADDLLNLNPPSRDTYARCRWIVPFKSFLVAGGVTENGVYGPNTVWWSDATNLAGYSAGPYGTGGPPDWDYESPGSLSGKSEIGVGDGRLEWGHVLNESLICYNTSSATAMQVVGGSGVMDFRRLFNKGCAGLNLVAEYNNLHFVLSRDQIYTHDGSTVKLIAKDRVEDEFFKRAGKGGRFGGDTLDFTTMQVVKNPDRKEINVLFDEIVGTVEPSPECDVVDPPPYCDPDWTAKDDPACGVYSCDAFEQAALDLGYAVTVFRDLQGEDAVLPLFMHLDGGAGEYLEVAGQQTSAGGGGVIPWSEEVGDPMPCGPYDGYWALPEEGEGEIGVCDDLGLGLSIPKQTNSPGPYQYSLKFEGNVKSITMLHRGSFESGWFGDSDLFGYGEQCAVTYPNGYVEYNEAASCVKWDPPSYTGPAGFVETNNRAGGGSERLLAGDIVFNSGMNMTTITMSRGPLFEDTRQSGNLTYRQFKCLFYITIDVNGERVATQTKDYLLAEGQLPDMAVATCVWTGLNRSWHFSGAGANLYGLAASLEVDEDKLAELYVAYLRNFETYAAPDYCANPPPATLPGTGQVRGCMVYNFEDDNYTWMDAAVDQDDRYANVAMMHYTFNPGYTVRWSDLDMTWATLETDGTRWSDFYSHGSEQNMYWLASDGIYRSDQQVKTDGVKGYFVVRDDIDLDDVVQQWNSHNYKFSKQAFYHIEQPRKTAEGIPNPFSVTMGAKNNLMDPSWRTPVVVNLNKTANNGKHKADYRVTGRYLAMKLEFNETGELRLSGAEMDAEEAHGR